MNVLSLFDGMSCGQIALERTGIPVHNYYASEVDKHAIKVTKHNYPGTIHIGDVRNVNGGDYKDVGLVLAGSPCQGFSVAGNGLNFDDPRSKLFFDFGRILNEVRKLNPQVYFMLENVRMKKEHELVITKYLGVKPIRLNSSLVSAQERKRLYWTNIPVNTIPKNTRTVLSDILENGSSDRMKSYCIDANYFKGGSVENYKEKSRRQIDDLASTQSERRLMVHSLQPRNGRGNGGKGPLSKEGVKSYCLDTANGQALEIEGSFRKLTVKECCRLQNVPDNYFEGIVSNTQAYKMLGNGWTVDIIVHILKHMKTA